MLLGRFKWKSAVLSAALPFMGVADQTLVWTGSAGNLKWETPANWAWADGSSGDIAAVLSETDYQKAVQTVYDLSSLNGQTVTLTSANAINFGGLKLPTCATGETPFDICLEDAGDTSVKFTPGISISVPTGCRFTLRKKKDTSGSPSDLNVTGGGTFRIDAAFHSDSRNLVIGKNTTLAVGANTPFGLAGQRGMEHTRITFQETSSTLTLERDMAIGLLDKELEWNPSTVKLNGHGLYMTSAGMINTGWGRITNSIWNISVEGGGLLSFAGQHTTELRGNAKVDVLRVGNADLFWNRENIYRARPALVIDGAGSMRLLAEAGKVWVKSLAGEGVTGAFRFDDRLSVVGDETADATALATRFDGRILGTGNFVKGGKDYSLTLTGVNGYGGSTQVASGELILERGAEPVPEPFARWTFDDADNPGKESTGRGMDLTLDGSAQLATDVPFAKDDKALLISGAAGCATFDPAAHDGFPAGFPTGASSFSVACRFRQSSNDGSFGCIVGWGDQTTVQKFFMLEKQGNPRKLVVNWNTLNNWQQAMHADEPMDCVPLAYGAEWTYAVVTVDRAAGLASLYTDGRLVATSTALDSLDIDPSGIFSIGLRTTRPTLALEAYIDDVQVFDRALNAYEVKSLVRAFDTGTVGPVLPPTSAVTVNAGATLKAVGPGHAIASLTGEGTLEIAADASIAVRGAKEFAGAVTGAGELRMAADATPVFSGDGSAFTGVIAYDGGFATFSSSFDHVARGIAEGATLELAKSPVALDAARNIRLPKRLTLDLGDSVRFGEHVLATAASFTAADGSTPDKNAFRQWDWTPKSDAYKVYFSVVDGELRAFVGKKGFAVIIR